MRRSMLELPAGVYRVKRTGCKKDTICKLHLSTRHSDRTHTYFAYWPNPKGKDHHDVGLYMWDYGSTFGMQWGSIISAERVSLSEEQDFLYRLRNK